MHPNTTQNHTHHNTQGCQSVNTRRENNHKDADCTPCKTCLHIMCPNAFSQEITYCTCRHMGSRTIWIGYYCKYNRKANLHKPTNVQNNSNVYSAHEQTTAKNNFSNGQKNYSKKQIPKDVTTKKVNISYICETRIIPKALNETKYQCYSVSCSCCLNSCDPLINTLCW